VLLVFGAPGQLKTLAGQEHGRTIPLADIGISLRPGTAPAPCYGTRKQLFFVWYFAKSG